MRKAEITMSHAPFPFAPPQGRLPGNCPSSGPGTSGCTFPSPGKRSSGDSPWNQQGGTLLYLIIAMTAFAILGTVMVSMYNAAVVSQATPNQSRRANYMAESGLRYTLSQIRTAALPADAETRLSMINGMSAFSFSGGVDRFSVRIYPYSFKHTGAGSPVTQITATVPYEGLPADFVLPTPPYKIRVGAKTVAVTGGTIAADRKSLTFNFASSQTFTTSPSDVYLVLPSANALQTVSAGGSLNIASSTVSVFPDRNATFRYRSHNYTYRSRSIAASPVTLSGVNSAEMGALPVTIPANADIALGQNIRADSAGMQGQTSPVATKTLKDSFIVSRIPTTPVTQAEMVSATPVMPPGKTTILVNPTSGNLTLGNVALGYGSVWYPGNNPDGACVSGVCNFNTGVRTIFKFQFMTADNSGGNTGPAQGFTFAVANAANNDLLSTGGVAAAWGAEMLGYAGAGNDGTGIQAPKMAVEIDAYPNTGTQAVRTGRTNTRRDNTDRKNHVAVVYWGQGSTLLDDNRHGAGAGSASEPLNPDRAPSDGSLGYYDTPTPRTWMENPNNIFAIRIEIVRSVTETTPGSGRYAYNFKIWGPVDTTVDPNFENISLESDYTAVSPSATSSITLNSTRHAQFNTILMGWTVGTSGTARNITISGFKLVFR